MVGPINNMAHPFDQIQLLSVNNQITALMGSRNSWPANSDDLETLNEALLHRRNAIDVPQAIIKPPKFATDGEICNVLSL